MQGVQQGTRVSSRWGGGGGGTDVLEGCSSETATVRQMSGPLLCKNQRCGEEGAQLTKGIGSLRTHVADPGRTPGISSFLSADVLVKVPGL